MSKEPHSAEFSREPTTLVELLRLRATQQSERTAYSFLADGETQEERQLSYGELDSRARAIAALLASSVATGQRVLLLYGPGLDYVAAFFGCLYAGAVAVPAYPPRLNRNLHRLQAIVSDAGATAVLTSTPVLSRLEPVLPQLPDLARLRWLDTFELERSASEAWREPPALTEQHLAMLQYTSGSTGTPKGVMLSHRNLLYNSRLMRTAFEYDAQSRCVSWLPMYHDMGLIGGLLQPLYGGYPCALMSPASFLQRPTRWLEAITEMRATISGGPNFAYELCLRRTSEAERSRLDLSSWQVAFNGAEPVRAETLERFAEFFEPVGFRRTAWLPCYGLAEATLMVAGGPAMREPVVKSVEARALERNRVVERKEEAHTKTESKVRRLVSSGRSPDAGQQIRIVDPELMSECEAEEVGEIWVMSPSVAEGYWNRSEETATTFGARLTDNNDGPYLRTGDLGFIEEGELYITGRVKDLVIIRGVNHYPQDIEWTVAATHASLRSGGGAAFAIEAENEERLVIVQEVGARAQVDLENTVERIRQAVAEEHEVEVYAIALVRAGSVPKTTSGKVQRRACREAYLSGDLNLVAQWKVTAGTGRTREAGEAQSPTQIETLAPQLTSREELESWMRGEVAARLRVDEARIRIEEPLTRFGIDSLAAIELLHAIETRTGVMLLVASLFEGASVRDLAAEAWTRSDPAVADATALPSTSKPSAPAMPEKSEPDERLSRGQQALWFLHRLAPESAGYQIARAARIVNALDTAALRRAFERLVERHAALRTTFESKEGRPVRRVHEQMPGCFTQMNAEQWSDAELKRRLETEAHRPFDLEQGPLMRVTLYKRATDNHVLLLVIHHLIADLWSLTVLLKELSKLYEAEKSGERVGLRPLSASYDDYIEWQERMLRSAEGERLWSYWQQEFCGELPVLELPTDHPRLANRNPSGGSVRFNLSAELTRRLKSMCEQQEVTLYVTLLAAFQILLSRYSGQSELIVGSPTTGRSRAEWAGIVGYFVNPVALRAPLHDDPSFESYLQRVRRQVSAALKHQDYPFPLIAERILQGERDASRSPIFQVMFALQSGPGLGGEALAMYALGEHGARIQMGALEMEAVGIEWRAAQFELTLLMAEADEQLAGSLEYDAELFERTTIERMSSHYRHLLEEIAEDANSGRHVSELRLLSGTEREQLLERWNNTVREFPRDRCVQELFEEQVEHDPARTALVFGHEQLSYSELNRRANRLAHRLRRLGVGPEVRVGVYLERSIEMIVGLLAILKAGGAYVPLDTQSPAARIDFMLEDAGVALLITREGLAQQLSTGATLLKLDSELEEIDKESEANPRSGVVAQNLAYVIYTSGSTGKPKGVMIQHESLLNLIFWHREAYGVSASDRATQLAGVAFDASVWEIWPYLTIGASLYLPDEETRVSPASLKDWLAAQAINICFLPTPIAESLLSTVWPGEIALRTLLTGGDRLHHYPSPQPGFDLVNHYGPTENTVVTSSAVIPPLIEAEGAPPIGRPIANTQVYVLDQALQPVPIGVKGELYVGGAGVGRGYLNRPELTAERFIPDPFSTETGARLYRTGDVVRWLATGDLEYIGRSDEQVKIRGFRIELGEIEAVLGEHPQVRECVLVIKADAAAVDKSSAEKRLIAYVVPLAAEVFDARDLRNFLKRRLPEYMIPAAFMLLDELPRTENGKVDRRALPAPAQLEGESEYAAPRTSMEQRLTSLWQEVLRLERVGIHDSFFVLGGHSILAAQLVSRMRDVLQIELPLHQLFETPTIAELSSVIQTSLPSTDSLHPRPILPVSRDTNIPLSYAQQRLWFLDQLQPDSPFYNIPSAVRLSGSLHISALERAFNEILRRHE
ncbi:MAG TPA: amino acid adenylation domain-containing protein, partial [Pyrinomonadaceae bacterium]